MRIGRRILVLSAVFLAAAIGIAVAADTKSAEGSPQAKAYKSLLKTVAAGDFEGYKKCMTKESSTGIDKQIKESGMEPKKGMELLKMMSPSDLKFTSLKVDGKKATLEAAGKIGGEASKGTIAMEEEDGQWKVAKQSWTNAAAK
jgi:hypothetical protein